MNNKSIIDEMKSYYDHRAPWHDEYMNYQGIEKMENLFSPIIKIIKPLITNKTILELACGTGNWTQVIAKRANHLTALDSSQQSLEIAKKKLSQFKNISYICSDVYLLEILKNKSDLIFAADFFSHIPKTKIDSFILMLNKIMKPGSPVIFLEMSENQFFQSENNYIDNNGNRVSKRNLPDGTSYNVIKNFQTKEELQIIFSKYGSNFNYTNFESLQRWMIVYHTK